MQIIKSSGCTAFYTDIDGKDLNDLTEDEKKNLLDKLIKQHLKYGIDCTINMLLDNIECDDSEMSDTCEQCGDNVYKQIYNLED